jgi:hypothetical protein
MIAYSIPTPRSGSPECCGRYFVEPEKLVYLPAHVNKPLAFWHLGDAAPRPAGPPGGRSAREPPVDLRLTLLTRHDCGLCAEMAEVVSAVAESFAAAVETVDVDGDAELRARHGHEVPVLLINGRKAFKYRVEEGVLRRRLRAERRRQWWRAWRSGSR